MGPSSSSPLDDLALGIRAVLGNELVGLYLYGSAVSGGFNEGVSDLDLGAVTASDLPGIDLAGLEAMHDDLARRWPEWRDRIEVVYVGRPALASFRTSAGPLAVISPGERFHLRSEAPLEWVQNWYLIREAAIALHGPPAAELVPRIEWTEFAGAAARYADEVAGQMVEATSPGSLAYAVLTMCRAQMTIHAGRRASKQDAAAWVRERSPEWARLIDAALECRLALGARGFDDDTTRTAALAFLRLGARGADGSRSATTPGGSGRG